MSILKKTGGIFWYFFRNFRKIFDEILRKINVNIFKHFREVVGKLFGKKGDFVKILEIFDLLNFTVV